jgi:proline iminopeptidase
MSVAAPAVGAPARTLRTLHPEIEPFKTHRFKVDDIHEIYVEECGDPSSAKKVLVTHGGPGGGISPGYRRFFPPSVHMVLIDQRGAGKSTPAGCLINNTTQHLIDDMELVRKALKIDEWACVFGGSWGSTISLAYSESHPERVKGLVLRGIFTLRREELLWFYQSGPSGGAAFIYPDAWDSFLAPIPIVERHDLMSAYYRRLTNDADRETQLKCAQAWTAWEMVTSKLQVDADMVAKAEDPEFALTFARIESHYFVNGGFFKNDSQLIDGASILSKIPTSIVQGRYDLVCPMKTAWDLKKKMPHAKLRIVHAGHSASELETTSALVEECEEFAKL